MMPRSPWSTVAATLIFLISRAASCFASFPEDAVVKIFLTTANGRGAVGTGALVSSDGQVLTCYHVVKDATKIQVFYKKSLFKDITVKSISSSYDLAIIKMNSFPQGERFFNIETTSVPSTFAPRLDTYGFPAGTSDSGQHLDISLTNSNWVPSREFRDSSGAALFNRSKSVDLITFTMITNNGDSGAPVISRNGIVGVISGSFQEGGSISWAIPVKYVSEMIPINKYPSDINPWPDLDLMTNAWHSLRREASLTVPLVVSLEGYSDILEQLKTTCSFQVRKVPDAQKLLQQELENASAAAATLGSGYVVSKSPELFQSLNDPRLFFLLLGFGSCSDLYGVIHASGLQLTQAVSDYFAAIPNTPANSVLHENTKKSVGKMNDLMRRLDNVASDRSAFIMNSSSTIDDYRTAVITALALMEKMDPKMTVDQLLGAFDGYDDIVEAVLSAQSNAAQSGPK